MRGQHCLPGVTGDSFVPPGGRKARCLWHEAEGVFCASEAAYSQADHRDIRWHPQLRSGAGEQTPEGISRENTNIALSVLLQGPMRLCFTILPVRRWLGTPKLVRETSRRHWWQRSEADEKMPERVSR